MAASVASGGVAVGSFPVKAKSCPTSGGTPSGLRAEIWAELEALSVRLGKQPVLRDLSVCLRGRCVGLLGPNGAGKTTLLNTLLGFHRSRTGVARILGENVGNIRAVRPLVGYMPERDSFVAGMSGLRFVRLMGELSGLGSETALERAHEACYQVGLGEARYRPVDSYSAGMKQLVKLAQAIVHRPRVLFLDEPTNGLDPPGRDRMLRLVREIRDAGEARILFSSHLLRDVEECCDEALVLKEGRAATHCDIERERQSNRKFLNLELQGDAEAPAGGPPPTDAQAAFVRGMERLGCEVGKGGGRRLSAVLPDAVETTALYELALAANVRIRRLDYKRDSLEDIFQRAMQAPAETTREAETTPDESATAERAGDMW